MFGRILSSDQRLYIAGHLLSGVASFDGNFNTPFENVDAAGYLNAQQFLTQPLERSFSFSRNLVGTDPLLYLTGDIGVGGSLVYKRMNGEAYQNFGFNSGYLSNYKISARIGELAKVDTDFVVYNNMGGNVSGSDALFSGETPLAPALSSEIYLNATEGETNRIIGFDYSITCKRMPQYIMGSLDPKFVVLKKPLPILVNLEVQIDDYLCNDIQRLVCNPYQQNLTINLNKCGVDNTIQAYSVNNARLINNSFNSALLENASVKLTYQAYTF